MAALKTDELAARRFDALVEWMIELLTTRSGGNFRTDGIDDVEQWRKAARAAGRRLNICVRTGVSRDGTIVWVSEGP
jgi:hypothetical protein